MNADLTVGQCVSSADYESYQLRATDCSDIDAVYEYAGKATMNICPDGKRTEDGNLLHRDRQRPRREVLLRSESQRGRVLTARHFGETGQPRGVRAGCVGANSHTGAVKVSQRIDGSSDESRCSAGTKALAFITPERVYCVQNVSDGWAR